MADQEETQRAAAKRLLEQTSWLAENEAAIAYYNAFVEKHGVFGEELRQF